MRTLGALGLALLAITVNGVTNREKDSNGDGVGDLVGITSKMKYFADIGIDAAVLSSPFRSPLMDFGYDVSDFYDIQPEYGNLRDFEKLVEEAHRHGIKLILEFSPNHSSDQNEWFKKSVAGDPEYSGFYVWRPAATGGGPPNNWLRIHPNYTHDNVDVMQKNPLSTFHHFQHLTKLQRHRTMKSGECLQKAFGLKVYALLRELRGEDSFLTVLNMSGEADTVDLGDFVNLPQKMRVELAQPNSRLQAGNEVDISKLTLGPYDSVVLRALTSSAAATNLSIGLLLSIMAMYISV